MSIATTSRHSANSPWAPPSVSRAQTMPPTTPHTLPPRTPGTRPSPKDRSSHHLQDPRTGSPGYFELTADPSNDPADSVAGGHAKRNWSSAVLGLRQSPTTSSTMHSADSRSRFEAFRRQSQTQNFELSHGSLSHFSTSTAVGASPTTEPLTSDSRRSPLTGIPGQAAQSPDRMDVDPPSRSHSPPSPTDATDMSSHLPTPLIHHPPQPVVQDLPNMQEDHSPHRNEGRRPDSVPQITTTSPSLLPEHRQLARAETLPQSLIGDGPCMISPRELVAMMDSHIDMLLLDLRVFPQFSQSRIDGAINLCIPTTLLKRSSFNVQKLAETFTKENEKAKFDRWREAQIIAVYDGSSTQLKDATSSVNTLRKFISEGWQGSAVVVRGGYLGFAKNHPDHVDKRPASEMENSSSRKLTIDPRVPAAAPLAGGCPMPAVQTAANPFFGSIRQNMDLIGGVGQMAVQLPAGLKSAEKTKLPTWLRKVTDAGDNGRNVAERFLEIEKAEQQRMQKALSSNVYYGPMDPGVSRDFQIAGLEKGIKNRYKDMLPYNHSRVKLKNVPVDGCDYINASHVESKWGRRHYIATQAPVPATFNDFWRVVWEQDVHTVVMLTAESECGQVKCHPYWLPSDYGPFKLASQSERRLALHHSSKADSALSPSSHSRPGIDRRRSTNTSVPARKDFPQEPRLTPQPSVSLKDGPARADIPQLIIRKLALSNGLSPSEPVREITQLQFSSWPDFGTPAHPSHVLALVKYCRRVVNEHAGTDGPVVVHCSAGCGRTGTFCTIDSVIGILQRQMEHHPRERNGIDLRPSNEKRSNGEVERSTDHGMADNVNEDWLTKDDIDLVAHTVSAFRVQRLSMVQTLRQFVLCYESVLEWMMAEMRGKDG